MSFILNSTWQFENVIVGELYMLKHYEPFVERVSNSNPMILTTFDEILFHIDCNRWKVLERRRKNCRCGLMFTFKICETDIKSPIRSCFRIFSFRLIVHQIISRIWNHFCKGMSKPKMENFFLLKIFFSPQI